ncbi:PA3496 family putative envelope integrity protein [Shewanella sp. GXUN23E]|uniref:PA3496 family putative envelope integrity protein n=1 Tax=Shewanella sp. GXUN23E TaxID=3422498 RepID=UPI003D7D8DE1
MPKIVDTSVEDDLEMDDVSQPQNPQAAKSMEQKRQLKRRLDDYFEQRELRRALGLDD